MYAPLLIKGSSIVFSDPPRSRSRSVISLSLIESEQIVEVERAIVDVVIEGPHVREAVAVAVLQAGGDVPLVRAGRRDGIVPHRLGGRRAPRRGEAAQHLLLVAGAAGDLQLQRPPEARQQRGVLVVGLLAAGVPGGGGAGVGREADEA